MRGLVFGSKNESSKVKKKKKANTTHRVDEEPVLAAVLVEARGGAEACGPGADDEDADLFLF